MNRSELHMRLGLAEGVTFPRVPGVEAVGIVAGAVYQIDQIVEAHTAMEEGRVAGKIVVLT